MILKSNNTETILRVEGIGKSFGKKRVLSNVSFSVRRGEIFGILGKNGAGKTVLINILLGLIKPDTGSIRIFGRDLQQNLSAIRQRINFASSFQSLQLQASIRDNLYAFAGLYQISDPKEKSEKLLKIFGIQKLANQGKKLFHLSSGENTKAMLCKAFINDPEIVFLDEPTASLDPIAREDIIRKIKKYQHNLGISFIYTSHNIPEIVALCRNVMVLKNGLPVYIGPIGESIESLIKRY